MALWSLELKVYWEVGHMNAAAGPFRHVVSRWLWLDFGHQDDFDGTINSGKALQINEAI